MLRTLPSALATLLCASTLFSVELTPEQEAQAETIDRSLISPCCWTTSVAEHGSGSAPKIQSEVREMLASGMSPEAIIAHYVELYGDRILTEPPRRGFNLVAYWMPWLALVVGLGVILFFARRTRSDATPVPPRPAGADTDDPYRRRIREELRRLDA
jgi:cytochrome c-type biogenesis protein CcmH